jgi:hypothetical protein
MAKILDSYDVNMLTHGLSCVFRLTSIIGEGTQHTQNEGIAWFHDLLQEQGSVTFSRIECLTTNYDVPEETRDTAIAIMNRIDVLIDGLN